MTAGHQPEHGTLDPSRVYNDYHDRVLAYLLGKNVSHEDAEDLCHTVFEKVFRALPDYDAEKASLTTWIYRITHNTLTDHYRTRREGVPLPDDLPRRAISNPISSRRKRSAGWPKPPASTCSFQTGGRSS